LSCAGGERNMRSIGIRSWRRSEVVQRWVLGGVL
jgi:hypothetical protein